MSRSVLAQLVAFVIIGVVVTVFGVRYVAGPQSFGGAIDVTIRAADAFGVDAGTSVTYRGVPVGHVTSVDLDARSDAGPGARPDEPEAGSDGGPRTPFAMSITAALDPDTRIPRSATARVVGASALGIRTVDIAADTSDGPYLRQGDTITAPTVDEPVRLGDLLADASALLDGIDPDAVRSLGRTAATALDGTGPTLRGIIEDTDRISAMLDAHAGTLASLADDAVPLLHALASHAEDFPETVRAGRDVADQLADSSETLTHLFDASPAMMRRADDLLTGSRGDIGGILTGADTATGIIGARDDSLAAGLDSIPHALSELASIVHDGRADFVLVATQGPTCYYDTQRREVGDTAPRAPTLDEYCPPGKDLEQRGSRNAPRPDGLGLRGATRPGTPIGPRMADDPLLIPTGEQMLRRLQEGDGS